MAIEAGQKNIQAISISSFNKSKNEVDSRFVNLKFIDNRDFIFFSNYNSPKSKAFDSHNQISSLLYWETINCQIRIKAKIRKTRPEYNQKYFQKRSLNKNALAISSNQSNVISSFDQVKANYEYTKNNKDLKTCPDFWGGFAFTPFEIEFWEGDEFRLNKRSLYKKYKTNWNHLILEP